MALGLSGTVSMYQHCLHAAHVKGARHVFKKYAIFRLYPMYPAVTSITSSNVLPYAWGVCDVHVMVYHMSKTTCNTIMDNSWA